MVSAFIMVESVSQYTSESCASRVSSLYHSSSMGCGDRALAVGISGMGAENRVRSLLLPRRSFFLKYSER